MSKQILVTITKSRHKKQPFTFEVNMPGNAPEQSNDERYTVRRSAWRGALRFLDACKYTDKTGHFAWVKGTAVPIVFKTKDNTKRAQK